MVLHAMAKKNNASGEPGLAWPQTAGSAGSADLFIVARDHLARAVCGVGFLANIQIFAAKTALHPIPTQAPRIHANKSARP